MASFNQSIKNKHIFSINRLFYAREKGLKNND
jgi:hypothetical protein